MDGMTASGIDIQTPISSWSRGDNSGSSEKSSSKTFYHDSWVFEKIVWDRDYGEAVKTILAWGKYEKDGFIFSLATWRWSWEILVWTAQWRSITIRGRDDIIHRIDHIMKPHLVSFDIDEDVMDTYFPKISRERRIAEDNPKDEPARDMYVIENFKRGGYYHKSKALVTSDFLRFNLNRISLKEGKYRAVGSWKTVSWTVVQIFEIEV
jgi:hypothetical protein